MHYIFKRVLTAMLRKKLKLDENVKSVSAVASNTSSISDKIIEYELELNKSLKDLTYKQPITYVYSPLEYAFIPHNNFTHKYCKTPKKILFVGMNPGPWGMCQTGVPFGEVKAVKEWLNIEGEVTKPENECPDRKVTGLNCTKSEVSGQRIWGLFKNICVVPENFFDVAYMYNYCPLAFMKTSGVNVTPAEIKGETQRQLEELCDKTLYKVIQLLESEIVVGVGKFAEKRALEVLKKDNPLNTKVVYLTHPSPRVANNQNWIQKAEILLNDLNILAYFKRN